MPKPIFIHESITSCRRLSSPANALKNLSFLCEDGKALHRSLGGTGRVVATCKMSIFLVLRTDMHRLCKRFRKSLLGTKIKSLPSVLILPCFFMFFKRYWWLLLKDSNLSLILFGVLDTSVFRVQMWRSGTTYFLESGSPTECPIGIVSLSEHLLGGRIFVWVFVLHLSSQDYCYSSLRWFVGELELWISPKLTFEEKVVIEEFPLVLLLRNV